MQADPLPFMPPGKPIYPEETITEEDIYIPMFIEALLKIARTYNNNEKREREIKETISFTIATERIKYTGINLPKETKDLYI